MNIRHIAIFASGSGTNAQNIMEYFAGNQQIKVSCLLSNTSKAYAITRAGLFGIETLVFSRADFYNSLYVSDYLSERKIDLIVLAGFLWLVPVSLIEKFTIVNIHPALLPKYGGKNMYGHYVHQAVINNREKFSGISIHFVNEKYDDGAVIFQAQCTVEPDDTPEILASKIHLLEYEHYPRVIEQVILSLPRC